MAVVSIGGSASFVHGVLLKTTRPFARLRVTGVFREISLTVFVILSEAKNLSPPRCSS